MRKGTEHLDKQIIFRLRLTKITPKSLAYEMGISVWRVYHAVRRKKKVAKNKACA